MQTRRRTGEDPTPLDPETRPNDSGTARLAESQALRRAIGRFATRREWLASSEGPELAVRLERHLSRVRRLEPSTARSEPPGAARDDLHAVHWNVLHGTQYDSILRALREEPALLGADLLSLNETDLGLARSGNRDVAFDLARELGMHAAWAALFLELEAGFRAPPEFVRLEQREALFGLALLSRFPLGAVQRLELDTPEDLLFDRERHIGRFVALVVEVLRPGRPFHAIVTHLDVHGSPQWRLAQMQTVLDAAPAGPAILMGDLNTTTFRRGSTALSLQALGVMALVPRSALRARFLAPHQPLGAAREPLFDALRARDFEVGPFNDDTPSLDVRFDDVHEIDFLRGPLRRAALALLHGAERRSALRLDWIAARGFAATPERPPFALPHLMRGPDAASDHAPIGCGLRAL
jgi:endonuclease/exonuclease/phosphatase family metal-dependent hydrolase